MASDLSKGTPEKKTKFIDLDLNRFRFPRALMNETLKHKIKHDWEQLLFLVDYNRDTGRNYDFLLETAEKYKV